MLCFERLEGYQNAGVIVSDNNRPKYRRPERAGRHPSARSDFMSFGCGPGRDSRASTSIGRGCGSVGDRRSVGGRRRRLSRVLQPRTTRLGRGSTGSLVLSDKIATEERHTTYQHTARRAERLRRDISSVTAGMVKVHMVCLERVPSQTCAIKWGAVATRAWSRIQRRKHAPCCPPEHTCAPSHARSKKSWGELACNCICALYVPRYDVLPSLIRGVFIAILQSCCLHEPT